MMKSWQVILLLGVLGMGVVAGLAYGWLINPVEYIDTSMDSLRIDYQTDLVLMTAEVYSSDSDLTTAIQKLTLVRRDDIKGLMRDTVEYARQMNFSTQDIEKLILFKDSVDLYVNGDLDLP